VAEMMAPPGWFKEAATAPDIERRMVSGLELLKIDLCSAAVRYKLKHN
jgi:hypothetical protein